MAVGDFRQPAIIGHGEVEDVFADPAGELLDWPVIAVRDHRSNIHRDIPFHFDVKGELLPGSCVAKISFFLLSAEFCPANSR